MIRNNLSWINLNAGSSGGSGGGGVSDYNDLANRPIISMTGTSQNPLKLWNLSTGLYLLNGYVYYNTTNTRECVNLFVSITAQIQNSKYVLSAFVPSWEGHYEYIKANSTSTDYTDTQILKMLTEDDVLTLTNEVEYTPTTDYHPSTKKYVDEAMQSVMEEFAKMGVNEQDIKTLIAENRRRDIAIQALLNETADKNVTIEEDTHTISLDYSMEDGMATVNSIEGSTLVNVSKTVDEIYVTKSQDRVEQTKVANTIGEQNGKLCPIIEGDTLVNVCNQKDPIAITKSYTVENSGNHIALQGEYDGSCRPVIQGNTMVNLDTRGVTDINFDENSARYINCFIDNVELYKPSTTYTIVLDVYENTNAHLIIGEINPTHMLSSAYLATAIQPSSNTKGRFIDAVITPDDISGYTSVMRNYVNNNYGEGHIKYSIMIFEGDLTQTPELIPTEYVEGLKSSFEDNVVTQAMVDSGEESAENLGKYKVEYKVTGKNKFDGELIQGAWNSDTDYVNTPNYICTKNRIKVNPSSNYKISGISLTASIILLRKDFSLLHIKNINMNDYFITPSNCEYIKIDWYHSTSITPIDYPNIQLEEGTVATEYEPYKEFTKTFYLNSPLLEGDTIEDINGVATHVKRYEKVVLDGSDDEEYGVYRDNDVCKAVVASHYLIKPKESTGICNNFLENSNNVYNGSGEGIWTNSTTSRLYVSISKQRLGSLTFKQWFQQNPTTIVYELASPIYEPISNESILCDSYVNGHLDFDSAVPIEKVSFRNSWIETKYLIPNTNYILQFEADNIGKIDAYHLGGTNLNNQNVTKGLNTVRIASTDNIINKRVYLDGIGFNASNIVVTEATDKDFDYFNGIQSTFEENLVTDENNPHYGKYRVIYRTKSSDGNASTVKSVYLNSPLLQGDKLVVVNGKLCHYHKMGMVVLNGGEDLTYHNSDGNYFYRQNINNIKGSLIAPMLSDKLIDTQDYSKMVTTDYTMYSNGVSIIFRINNNITTVNNTKQWLQANPITVVYELEIPYYEEITSNPKDTVVDFYANGTLEVQSAVYPLSMEFTSFEEELTYLYASTVYTVQFEANGNVIANITLGGTTVTNQEITHGLNRIQVTTPSTLIDNKLIIDGCGDCKISKVVVTNSTEEFDYFEGMKSAFEDKQNEDGTYTVEIVVYNAPIRLNKDKE